MSKIDELREQVAELTERVETMDRVMHSDEFLISIFARFDELKEKAVRQRFGEDSGRKKLIK